MITVIIGIGFFLGFILLLMGKDSRRNNEYNQIKESNEEEKLNIPH